MSLWSKAKKWAKKAVKVVKETVVAVAETVASTVVATAKDAAAVVVHASKAAWEYATGHPERGKRELRKARDAAANLLSDLTWGVLGAAAISTVATIAGIQRFFGAQAEPRPLNQKGEIDLLRDVFEDALQYDKIRVVEKRLGILDGGKWPKWMNSRQAPYTMGYTIYVPDGWTFDNELLVHESVHVWQFENGGPRYAPEAVRAQNSGGVGAVSTTPGYDFDNALEAGKRWPEFNPEQQAAFIEYVESYDHGLFRLLPGATLYVPPPPTPGTDYMANFVEAILAVRAGEGAAR